MVTAKNARLEEAQAEIQKHVNNATQKVHIVSVDLSADYKAVEAAIKETEDKLGPVSMLVNSAGMALNGYFHEIPIEDFRRSVDVNYIGSVYATRAVIAGMRLRQQGRIVFLSSQAGQLGLIGFSAYSPTKFALRGFAEALQMELKPYNIRVTIVYPPDTDTPGLAEEMKTKPKETKQISESSGVFQPEYVAHTILDDAIVGRYHSYVGMDGWMLAQLTAGMSPCTSLLEAIQQVCFMGIFRLISLFYLISFDGIVRKCKMEREQEKSQEKKEK